MRLNKVCEYPGTGTELAKDTPRVDNQRSRGQAGLLSPESPRSTHSSQSVVNVDFPASYFLNPARFTPVSAFALCGDQDPWARGLPRFTHDETKDIFDRYISTVHTWFPFLSPKRLSRELQTPGDAGAGVSNMLLLLCMKLVTQPCALHPGATYDEVEALYGSAKQHCTAAEISGSVSLRLIQALSLLAVYELGHAIYPCAYLTIGRAARLCGLIGLHSRKHAQQLFVPPETWTMREEQRRTWWAVFILDRYVRASPNVSTNKLTPFLLTRRFVSPAKSGMPFSAPEPGADALLPCCDDDWNAGRVSASQPLLVRTFHIAMDLGGFARTCQAAHMLSRVLAHVDPARQAGADVTERLSEALRYHEAFTVLDASLHESHGTLDDMALSPGKPDFTALAICCSARSLLYSQYGCNEPDGSAGAERIALETEAQSISHRDTHMMASTTIPMIARVTADAETHSPFIAHCMYYAAIQCTWFIKEDHDPTMYEALSKILNGLEAIRRNWRVGGKSPLFLFGNFDL